MKRFIFASVMLFTFLQIVPSCSKNSTDGQVELKERKDIVLTRAQESYVKAGNDFAFNLLGQVSASSKGKSFIFSPLSVTYAMGMVDNGASGDTRKEIDRTLGFSDGSVPEMNAFCKTMIEQSSALDPSTEIDIADAAVVNSLYLPLKESFSKAIESNYYAEVANMNFATDDPTSKVNSWCSEKTRGMIPKMLDEPLETSDLACFLNAVYFKGIWASKFDSSKTREEDFSLEDGGSVKVDMMHQESVFACGGNSVCSAICLPYGNQAFRLIILLPDSGKTLDEVASTLDSKGWDAIVAGMNPSEVDVKIPKFETGFRIELNDALKNLGIVSAFDADKADFSEMSPNKACIDRVLQKAKIKVDEDGTEAAAVTAVEIKVTSVGPASHTFHADHPFLYAITEYSTGSIFFIGQYTGK